MLDSYLDWCHETKIRPAGWVAITKDMSLLQNKMNIRCYTDEIKHLDEDSIAPLKICSFDIECYSTRDEKDGQWRFPQASNPEHGISMIASVFQRYGHDAPFFKHCVVIGNIMEPPDMPGVFGESITQVVSVKSEKDLLVVFIQLLVDQQPDMLLG